MPTQYTDGDFASPGPACDIIMKGGITSGVVYPLALTELAKRFRLAHVGGTSAGAIAAAAAAAAEYGRQVPGKGFMRLAGLPDEVGPRLFSFFQPTPPLKPLFNIFVAAMGSKSWTKTRVVCSALWGFRYSALMSAVPGALTVAAGWLYANPALMVLGALLIVVGVALGTALAVYRRISKGIPDNDFGVCPGKTQRGYSCPGLSDWLADLIDDIAGRNPATDAPLTFGDLSKSGADGKKEIVLRMMTTNLTLRRPYTLPFNQGVFAFKLSDFAKLFPERIVSYLAKHCEPAKDPGEHSDLLMFPDENLPLVVAARMSLSFPLLFCAVPLYAKDYTLREDERNKWRKNFFSDGGISSNFPIHFFDRMLPSSPTFAISLDEYDARRQPAGTDGASSDTARARVWLPDPKRPTGGLLIPGLPFHGIAGFLSRILDSAKDWQDNLQSTLAGYRDRIVHINLKPDEGGLNINMPPGLVVSLGAFGAQAGMDLCAFNLDEHRWRRFLVAMDTLNETLGHFTDAYDGAGGAEAFSAFLSRYPVHPPGQPIGYKAAAGYLGVLQDRAASLAAVGRDWRALPPIPNSAMPHPKTVIRIVPLP